MIYTFRFLRLTGSTVVKRFYCFSQAEAWKRADDWAYENAYNDFYRMEV